MRYGSIPVSRVRARPLIRSIGALHQRGLGITWVHSGNGKLVVRITVAFSGALRDGLEQEPRAHFGQWRIAHFINRNQVVARPASKHATRLQLMLGFDQLVDQRRRGFEEPGLAGCAWHGPCCRVETDSLQYPGGYVMSARFHVYEAKSAAQ